jgi:nucleotide-binding universal stress UspA family protein
MFKKILVPLDGSELAESVLPYVRNLAERFAAEIVLMQVSVDPVYDLILTGPKLADCALQVAGEMNNDAQSYLAQVARNIRDTGLMVSSTIEQGTVAETILACAAKTHSDLIVLSTHGRGGPMPQITGSVTYQILHQAQVPVLLINPQ